MSWFIILPIIVALTIWFAYLKPYSYWKQQGIIQTKPWIFLGDSWPTLFRTMNLPEWLDWLYYMYPGSRCIGTYQFYNPILFLRDPELIKELVVKNFDHFTDHNTFDVPEEVDALWSKNLFALKGQRWRDMRGLLSGSFTSSKMKMMYTLISERSQNFVKYFLNKNQDILEVDVKDNFSRCTNDIIASTAFGLEVDSLEDPTNEFYLMGKEATSFTNFTTMLKFMGYLFCPWPLKVLNIGIFSKRVTKFFHDIIDDTLKVREEQGIVRPDVINILLEVKKGVKGSEEKDVIDTGFAVVQESIEEAKPQKRQVEITNTDITAQAIIFFLAGFDSVATAMCFTCYELAVNPDVQEKLRKEIKETLNDCNGQVTYEALLKMKYLDMVVSETLRMWPSAPLAYRVCVKSFTLNPSNPEEPTITFKKGDTLLLPLYSMHRDPDLFPNPQKFNPERFSDQNKENIKPYTYMPFGAGPRACIGSRFALLEIKSVLFHLLNSFEIVPVQKTMIPLKIARSMLKVEPEGDFPLGFKRLKI